MLTIRGMTVADIPAGMSLKEQAGWNQVEADWRRLLDVQPDGCFLAERDGVAVGTVTTCRFGPVAWIAMMLVDPRFRRQGIGRALMTRALEHLDAMGVVSVRLDATPLGLPLYESLGFVVETPFSRFEGILPPILIEDRSGLAEAPTRDVLDGVIALDRAVTSTDRGPLLRRLAEEHPEALRVVRDGGSLTGFLLSRPGARARQIGPCIADERAGPRLLEDARRRHAGESVFLDIPTEHATASALAGSWGLTASRLLTRMGRGPRIVEQLDRLWAGAGPEKG